MPLSAIDLFSGAGGFSLGLKMAGVQVSHAVEVDKWAAQTFATNFPDVNLRVCDIRSIPDDEIPIWIPQPPDILVGGPPCQGFSHSNIVNRDPKDPRNSLFADFVRFAKRLKPKLCFIENVKGLLTSRNECGRKVIDIIRGAFEEIGYSCDYRILNAADFGIPQYRERLFIVAERSDLHQGFAWPTPRCTQKVTGAISLFGDHEGAESYVTLWEAISDLPQITADTPSSKLTYVNDPENSYQKLMREDTIGEILNHEPMRHTARLVERFSRISYGQSEADVPHHHWPRQRGNAALMSTRAYDQNSRRQRPDQPCNTMVASSHTNFLHPSLHRNFTVREILRIQSFPDWFIVKGKRAVLSKKLSERKGLTEDIYLDQRMQIGNAVPPLLAYEFGRAAIEALRPEVTACA